VGKQEKVDFLKENIDKQIGSFSARRTANKRKAFWFKMLATSFAAITTIMLGLRVPEDAAAQMKNAALVSSALVTLFGAWDGFFNHRALWVRHTITETQLKGIRSDLAYLLCSDNHGTEKEVDALYSRYTSVLNETNASWQQLRKDVEKEKAT
jgi:hypothetical protein